ncbi:tRNA (adenine(58)-N(1))-methyltransferase catalytic subunit trmt61a [Allomyces arbusculus]|nr:tRNA (adenine(58)-N(1))-methyltransferase catalytic subunit trmt61a [Allomyces arbusculus]
MSTFERYSATIAEGDLAILYRGHSDLYPIVIKSGEFVNNNKGYVIILHPTPELWTLSLPHRTQILYQADISIITSLLRLKPGSRVLESGTGSGSFSHSLIRTIAPTGHLYTFEYHEGRAAEAKAEFEAHGLAPFATSQCRDVCKDGFGLTNLVDAAFLDLPAPWEAVASAKQAMRKDVATRVCSFSPCIEQVARTVEALTQHGFTNIEMYECLLREHDVRNVTIHQVDVMRSLAPRPKIAAVRPGKGDEEVPAAPGSMIKALVRPRNDARGHTSFLTFATLLPQAEEADEQ